MSEAQSWTGLEIAVVGMAGRFPGAPDLDAFWRNLAEGVESISRFTAEELEAAGVSAAEREAPGYVPARGVLEGADRFDAEFFGYFPRDAEMLDPQQRLFLECAWEALESAGADPFALSGAAGVFAGAGTNGYLALLQADPAVAASADRLTLHFSTNKDYIATRTANRLRLRGPALTVQTACSTSLVAVHQACQSLLAGECSLALAGGAAVAVPQTVGHRWVPGGALSPDGHCRAFDAGAGGTLSADGVGVVVLKRLEDALADGDPVRAVILGSAINNDGGRGAGFTAPSVEGQAEVIRLAHAAAGVAPDTIGYVEAHGTGTPLGDPIEVAALTRAFRAGTEREGFCALGSVKTNVGHTDAAAGVAGLIKTVLAMEHGLLPPTLHFRAPNPEIPFAGSPFVVNAALRPWDADGAPRRAGVSSFGIGGTNAHVVLQEAPPRPAAAPSSRPQLVVLSARNEAALDAAAARLAEHLAGRGTDDLPDVAWTLQSGRHPFEARRIVAAADPADAAAALASADPKRVFTARAGGEDRPVVFLFPGGGAQYPGMARGAYAAEPVFRAETDRCAELLRPHLGWDVRDVLFPPPGAEEEAAARLRSPEAALPALFTVEYALAALWMHRGVRPSALLGHSLGEVTAACVAGVLSLEDALALAALRGRLAARMTGGAMLSVPLAEAELLPLLDDALSVAAVNGPEACVVSGPAEAVDALGARLAACGVDAKRLPIQAAGHSAMVDPLLAEFTGFAATLRHHPPRIPYLSNVTGTWITAAEVADPGYWGRHFRRTVRFADAAEELLRDPSRVFLEVGPGLTLSTLVRRHPRRAPDTVALPSLRHPEDTEPDERFLLTALGRLWAHGVSVRWEALHEGAERRRVPLPTYPFQRRRCWPGAEEEALPAAAGAGDEAPAPGSVEDRLLATWRRLFGMERIGVRDGFFELGGHSLLATRLVFELRRDFGVEVALRDLFTAPTVLELAARIRAAGAADGAPAAPDTRDLAADGVLDPAIARAWDGEPAAVPGTVLLTGATGYLGGYVLAALLANTDAEVRCLVRAPDQARGLRRIRDALDAWALWDPALAHRIVPVPGDLARPRLGLDADAFGRLADEVDAVVHCGAVVHFTTPYEQLRAPNVGGTEEVIRLVAAGRPKTLHHVSTLAVFPPPDERGAAVREEDRPTEWRGLSTGYAESKWVAEQLVFQARERGIPASILRPGAVFGDTRTGMVRTDDSVWRMVKGCIQLGRAPDRGMDLVGAPADFVAAALVHLAMRPGAAGRAFHLVDPEPIRWEQVFALLRRAGYAIRTVPLRDWIADLTARAERGEDNALYPLVHLLDPEKRGAHRFGCEATHRALEGSGIRSTPMQAGPFGRYLSHLVKTGFLEAPAGAAGHSPRPRPGGDDDPRDTRKNEMNDRTQVLVIGGGPAGSTAATLLVREGFQVTLAERDAFPREHVGESLLPSFGAILDMLGAREKVESAGFIRKYGAFIHWGPDEWEVRFGEKDDPRAAYAYQVVRSEFDKLLLDHAREQGVRVHERTEVRALRFDGERPVAASWVDRDDPSRAGEIAFDFVVDCSGRAGVLATRYLRNRRYNQGFQNVAVYGYWKGARELEQAPPGGLVVDSVPDGWIWAIPLHDGTMSVGLVLHKDAFKARRGEEDGTDALYRAAIRDSSIISHIVEPAALASPLYAEQDFSYVADRFAGPGYFIAGDSACFLDPLLASGVHLATFSSMLAAAAITSVMRGEIGEAEAESYYTNTYRLAYVRFLMFVSALYRNYRGRESLFWKAARMNGQDAQVTDIRRAFIHIISGLQDMQEAGEGARGVVLEEMQRLVDSYFPKEAGKNAAWVESLTEEERERIIAEVRPLNAATEFCLTPETALDGVYVRTRPLGLARVGAETAAVEAGAIADAGAGMEPAAPAGVA